MDADNHFFHYLDFRLVKIHLPYCTASVKYRIHFRFYRRHSGISEKRQMLLTKLM